MKISAVILVAISLMLANSSRAVAMVCDDTDLAKQLVAQRNLFNEAIRSADLIKIESILSDKNILITGSDSDLYGSKQAHLDIWQTDFASTEERVIYVRTPKCISVSKLGYMAMEYGQWIGQKNSGVLFSGSYTAKWRLDKPQQKWRLEAEVFMTSYIE